LDWRTKVELFEEIRREYEFGEGTIKGVARKLGVHRRMVREAVRNAVPPPRKKTVRPHSKLKAAIPFIESILEEDRKSPRKQRHTAHRIWSRVKEKFPELAIGERMVRKYVRRRKQALGLDGRETCIPQSYAWGSEGQVDWYEAYADLGGERTKLQGFSMRSMASGGAFHCAFERATQQAFLQAHEQGFHYFGGVSNVSVTTTSRWPSSGSCRGRGARRRRGLSRSGRTGGSSRSSAIRAPGTRRAG